MMLKFNKCIFAYDISCLDGEIFFLSEEKIINDFSGNVFSFIPIENEIFYFGRVGHWYWADNQCGQIFLFDSVAKEIVYKNRKEDFNVSIGWGAVFIDHSRILVSRRLADEKKM